MLDPFDYVLHPPDQRRARLGAYVAAQPDWFHSFRFGCGLVTPGRDPSGKKLHHLCLPASLNGLSVIDIGAYEGFFSFHAETRGASRVVAADRFVWEWPGATASDNFEAVHQGLDSRVERALASVEELPSRFATPFDVSMFLGVLYHTPDMVGYLRCVRQVTATVCILETLVDGLDDDRAMARLYAPSEVNDDASNWWAPNLRALELMLLRAGFASVELVNLWDINTTSRFKTAGELAPVRSGRVVVHAYT